MKVSMWPSFGPRRNRLQRCADQRLYACTGCSTRALRRNRNRLSSKRGWMLSGIHQAAQGL
jgi:hypothetical protein